MSLHTFSTAEKLAFVEDLILVSRRVAVDAGKDPDILHRLNLLKAIAADLGARVDSAPSIALERLDGRIRVVARSKTALGYSMESLRGLGDEVIARWPVIKQALELFGSISEDANHAYTVSAYRC